MERISMNLTDYIDKLYFIIHNFEDCIIKTDGLGDYVLIKYASGYTDKIHISSTKIDSDTEYALRYT